MEHPQNHDPWEGRREYSHEKYRRLSDEVLDGYSFSLERLFNIRSEGMYFIGFTRATLYPPYENCYINFYLGKPLMENFLPFSDFHEHPLLHLSDPTDGGMVEVADPSDIHRYSYQDTSTVWACLDPYASSIFSAGDPSSSHSSTGSAFKAKITEVESLIMASMDQMTEAATLFSHPDDYFVPDVAPESEDFYDRQSKETDWALLEKLDTDERVAMWARHFRGSFAWESTRNTMNGITREEMTDEISNRFRGTLPWNPPEANLPYHSTPHSSFTTWLEARANGIQGGPPSGAELNCWEAALVIAVLAGILDPAEVKRDSEVGDPFYVMKYFKHGRAHHDLKDLSNDIEESDFIGFVENDVLVHVGIVIKENREDYREIIVMSLLVHDNKRFTRIKWGKIIQHNIDRLTDLEDQGNPPRITGTQGTYFLYGPFA